MNKYGFNIVSSRTSDGILHSISYTIDDSTTNLTYEIPNRVQQQSRFDLTEEIVRQSVTDINRKGHNVPVDEILDIFETFKRKLT